MGLSRTPVPRDPDRCFLSFPEMCLSLALCNVPTPTEYVMSLLSCLRHPRLTGAVGAIQAQVDLYRVRRVNTDMVLGGRLGVV